MTTQQCYLGEIRGHWHAEFYTEWTLLSSMASQLKSLKSVGRKYEYKNVSYIETKPTFWTKMSVECRLFVGETHKNAQDNAISFQFQYRVFGVKMVPLFGMQLQWTPLRMGDGNSMGLAKWMLRYPHPKAKFILQYNSQG